ncbi:Ig-like domain-containing protein [Enterococcus faecalis]|uniref:Ig-like domain-containing protein n=1 Tax=Enterococcus TaxID=1350 RepID=UPI00115C5348|nr:Ig-like domain-containing protein [Enterococcus faecalis]EHD3890718.1 cell surface protein [Enterococcus faecalis]EKN1419926.1 cell surface protein [Enterococcus faecalis]MCU2204038.1 Ig-like domain-containing protein [Enterococcus faecalis]MCU2275797.1 Ig-like domain-containing protein [Enterococcus faecalis]NST76698.1 cell surface protein [Enterococcus faecalis]
MILVFIVYFKEKRDDQMKKKIVEDFNRKSQHKKWTKRKMLNLAISSGLLFTSLAIPVSIAVTSGTISASAAVLDIELLSNVTSNNDSGTSTSNRWTAANQNQPVNFTVSGGALADASAVFSGQKQAVLVVPPELRGNVAAAGSAAINTNVTIDLSKVTFLTAVLNAANDLTNVITQITSGALGNLTGVDIDLTEVNRQLELVNNIENLGAASFTAPETLAADGSYISAPISDGLGLVLAQNVSNILQDLNAAVQALEAKGTSIPSNLVATAINAALLPVKGTVNVAVSGALPLLAVGGSGVNELVDASLLGATTVTLPTTVSTPQNLSNNLDARFVGTVVQTDLLDVNLLATADGVSNIYFAAGTTSEVTAPTVTGVTGNSTAGYEVKGTADANATVEIRNAGGAVIGTGTADGTGAFTVTIPAGEAGANETLTAVAKNASGTESTPTTFQTPADEATVTAPTITGVTGNSTAGYEVKGTADANATVEIRNAGGTVIGTGTADGTGAFTVTIPAGEAGANETLTAVAKNASGTESTPTTFQTPADEATVTAPTITGVTGNSTAGYEIKGTADANATVEIRNAGGTVIGTGTADGTGAFTVTIPAGEAGANETLTAVAKNASGTESTPTTFQTPADPNTPVATPIVETVTGSTTKGYEVKGTAEVGTTIEVRATDGTVLGTATTGPTGQYTVTLASGKATAKQTVNVVAKNDTGLESQPTTAMTPADVTTPTIGDITGDSTTGYEITGTADPNTTIEVRNPDGTIIGTTTTDDQGNFTVDLPAGAANPGDTLTVVGKDGDGNESQPTEVTVPEDATVAAPTVTTVTGTTATGYQVTGTAEPNVTIEIHNEAGLVIATGTTDGAGAFTITLPTGTATANEALTAIAKDAAGKESNPTAFKTPADPDAPVATPTVDKITGSTTKGYQVVGAAEVGTTVEVRDADGTVLGMATTGTDGKYTVTLEPGKASANETITVVAKNATGKESQPATATTPADLATPTIDSITGNSGKGYEITGTAEPKTTIDVRDADGTIIAATTVNETGQYTVTLPAGVVTPGETITIISKDGAGNESQPATAVIPADVVLAAPTITKVEGNKANGYTVTGTADPNVTVQFYNSSEQLLASGNTTTGGTFSVHIAAGLATEKETLTALTTDTQGNVSPKTTFMTPADITGEPEIKIAAPTVSSVLGTSKAGYLIKGTAEPNRIIQISNRLLRSVIAVGATDAEGNFAIQLTAGQATAQQSLLATATDGAGHYSTATTFMTPADPTNPGGGNGNTGGNNGNTGGNTGNNGATGGNNGNGSNTGSNPNGGSGLGTTGSGLGSLGNGLGTNGSGYHPKLSTISYGTGNHGKTGFLPSTGEKESSAVTTSLFGAFVALLASMGIIKRKRKN